MVQLKDLPEIEKDVQPTKISNNIKEDKNIGDLLDDLVQKGKISITKNLYGLDWEFVTLNQGDLLESQRKLPIDGDDITKLYFLSIETLARSIKSIGGVPIHKIFKVDKSNKELVVEKMKNYLKQLSRVIVDDLFLTYSDLSGKVTEKLEKIKKK